MYNRFRKLSPNSILFAAKAAEVDPMKTFFRAMLALSLVFGSAFGQEATPIQTATPAVDVCVSVAVVCPDGTENTGSFCPVFLPGSGVPGGQILGHFCRATSPVVTPIATPIARATPPPAEKARGTSREQQVSR